MKTVMHFAPKCDANRGRLKTDFGRFIWLRDGVYYFKIELPRVDGKRRYKRLSLHTDNYYEALEKCKEYVKMHSEKYKISVFEQLVNNVQFIETENSLRLSKRNNLDDINEILRLHDVLSTTNETNTKVTTLLNRFEKMEPAHLTERLYSRPI